MFRFRREIDVEDEIYGFLKELRQQKFHDLVIDVRRQYEIKYDGVRKVDIAVLSNNQPLLLIETKIKKENRVVRIFRITSKEILGQVFSYAAILKRRGIYVPFVAVAHQKQIAIYKVPEDIEEWVNWDAIDRRDYDNVLTYDEVFRLNHDYRLKHIPIKFTKDFFVNLVDELTGIYAKTYKFEERRQELRYGIIEDLRDFVDTVSEFVYDAIAKETRAKKIESCDDLKKFYKEDFEEIVINYCKKTGYAPKPEILAREMAYVLMNKIIFYKILERFYDLPRLVALYEKKKVRTAKEYLEKLKELFKKARKERDFDPIFQTGIYDQIDVVEDEEVCNSLDWLINFIDWHKIEKLGDIIGYVYEDLIPAEERHQLGQFYTPKPIAELIVKWCVRDRDDKVLDPGCGSGTFLVEAYKILAELKLKKPWGEIKYVKKDVHGQILDQLWAFDINEFPVHLTAINLAMKNPREPIEKINVIREDFFNTSPEQEKLIPYKSYSEKIRIPMFDAVVGNPPYTRWTEIPDQTQEFIRRQVGDLMSKYNLTPQVSRGVEPGIYVFWIMHATKFLEPNGRLGMIISDSWLQADYGIGFANFLLDHYKVHAIIDISSRVFPVPLIGTCIILLERCDDKEERDNNKTVFMYLNIGEPGLDVNLILKAIERAKNDQFTWLHQNEFRGLLEKLKTPPIIRVYTQSELYNKKWIDLIFNVGDILEVLKENEKIVRLSEYFEPSFGNLKYLVLASQGVIRGVRNIGGEEFFYLSEDDLKKYKISERYVHPLLPSSDYLEFFTFNKEDWEKIMKGGKECYIFLAHEPFNKLPDEIKQYIRLGESEIRLKRKRKGEDEPRPVCESEASKARARYRQYFFGWYDLGGVLEAPIYVTYGAQYWIRFNLAKFNVALDHRILALIPKKEFEEVELKALLAFLNSSFSQLQAEIMGRSTGGGMIELDVKPLSNFLILDVRKLDKEDLETLASLFEKLEEKARELGNAKDVENVFGSELARELTGKIIKEEKDGLFNTVIKEIDYTIARIIGIPENIVDVVRNLVLQLVIRRLARVEAKPEALKGSEEFIVKPKRKSKRKKQSNPSVTLDKFGFT